MTGPTVGHARVRGTMVEAMPVAALFNMRRICCAQIKRKVLETNHLLLGATYPVPLPRTRSPGLRRVGLEGRSLHRFPATVPHLPSEEMQMLQTSRLFIYRIGAELRCGFLEIPWTTRIHAVMQSGA